MRHPSPRLRTVTGPLPPSLIQGPALAHEHLVLDLSHAEAPAETGAGTPAETGAGADAGGGHEGSGAARDAVLDPAHHAGAVTAELAALREEYGLALIVELTCRGMGRDPGTLVRIAQEAGVAVVAGTGWYYEPFHPREVRGADTGRLTETLIGDIEDGLDGTGVRPGVIGEAGSHGERPSEPEARTLTAAARAAVATGLSVATHAQLGRGGLAQLELLTREGLPPHRVSVGHQDLLDAPEVHRRLAAEGCYVAFDTVGKEHYQSDERRLLLLLALLEAGHADRVLLSCDISRHGYLRGEGGQGYGHLFRSFLPRAREAGVDEDLIDLMTRRNPLRFLTGASAEES